MCVCVGYPSCSSGDLVVLIDWIRFYWKMGKKRMMLPASEVDLTAVKYIPENIQGY